ncbi:uncharacterized protein LOC124172329 isoform X2 [Ischnura elegans]|uniref:uncharacterized protein LOC124156156 n=1 Tax=Ischnura elegans TaxID=197161 RepID=UPI001ED8A729|nr:uncharacterized protein LOC124155793 isoform X2 [Ischnura elegans]XP_046386469.1 uncharacterized protein LOC124156156 [Ischnura elegans]XP_046407730.1 uncharacterized protein LOC124172329 isoform X2 [Ischnura elegans]
MELEEGIFEVVVGESSMVTLDESVDICSTNAGTAGERSVAAQKSCQPKRPSLLKELNIVNNKVEAYEDNHLQMLKEIKEAIHGLQDQQSQLVGETREIAGSLRELVAVNGRIASALEKLTCGSEQ